MEESPRGRVAVLAVPGSGRGLAVVYKEGPAFEVVAVDDEGSSRPDWAALLRRGPISTARPSRDVAAETDWADWVERMAESLDPTRRPVALAAVIAEGRRAPAVR